MTRAADPAAQRLFAAPGNRFVLIAKSGRAVAFRRDADGTARVVERMADVDFRATGLLLRREGWRCVGPGLEYTGLLDA